MTVTTRQVTEIADGRRGVRDRYVCSFPRRHGSAGLVRSRTCRQCRMARPSARIPAERRFVVYVGRPAGVLHCVTVTYWPWLAGWGPRGLGRWITFPDND